MKPREPQELYHFSCYHGAAGISSRNMVLPTALHSPEAVDAVPAAWRWMGAYAWFTDIPQPGRFALGLTSHAISCDRLEYRFRVVDSHLRRPTWWPVALRGLRLEIARQVSLTPGALPAHWWVSSSPIKVEAA